MATKKAAKRVAKRVPAPAPIDRWKAVRKGAVYCAPACGRGCTWDEYQATVKAAATLVKTLNQMDVLAAWQLRVWENMGWHYSAEYYSKPDDESPLLEVYPNIERKMKGQKRVEVVVGYWAALQTASSIGQITSDHTKTPCLAVAQLRASLKDLIKAATRTAKEIGA